MKIKKLIELAEKATQGEWYFDSGNSEVETRLKSQYRDGICALDLSSRTTTDGDRPNIANRLEDGEYIAAACPANLIPILKCAERMAEALRCARENADIAPTATSKWAREVLEEWDSLNAEP